MNIQWPFDLLSFDSSGDYDFESPICFDGNYVRTVVDKYIVKCMVEIEKDII